MLVNERSCGLSMDSTITYISNTNGFVSWIRLRSEHTKISRLVRETVMIYLAILKYCYDFSHIAFSQDYGLLGICYITTPLMQHILVIEDRRQRHSFIT